MIGDNTNDGGGLEITPESPSIVPKSGWTTSQGQMTAIFTLICLVLGYFGINKTPEQLDSYVSLANNAINVALPILMALVAVVKYGTSRGKIQSNAINANATVMAAKETAKAPPLVLPTAGTTPMLPMGFVDDRFSKVIGGADWKDPERYGNILKIAEAVGVPGVSQASKINEQWHVDDLIGGIIHAVKVKKESDKHED